MFNYDPYIHQVEYTFCLILFFRDKACGSFQARGHIGATAAGRCHNQSNAGSLTHWARLGIEPPSSWMLVGFIYAEPRWERPSRIFLKKTLGIWKVFPPWIMYIFQILACFLVECPQLYSFINTTTNPISTVLETYRAHGDGYTFSIILTFTPRSPHFIEI